MLEALHTIYIKLWKPRNNIQRCKLNQLYKYEKAPKCESHSYKLIKDNDLTELDILESIKINQHIKHRDRINNLGIVKRRN